MRTFDGLAAEAGFTLFDYQRDALLLGLAQQQGQERLCLYYKTGAGKSLTALLLMAQWSQEACVVVAPPSTHAAWINLGARLGVDVEAMSHAKFRDAKTLLSRNKAVIADEFHLFGGHTGKGWKKLDQMARHLRAPLVLASATPNYNDADRVYCIQHVLDPASVKGGFIEFLYAHCVTQANRFSITPDVLGFRNYADAAEYLAALPQVAYLPDDLVYQIIDVPLATPPTPELDTFGLNARAGKIMASLIEERHARVNLALVDDSSGLRANAVSALTSIRSRATSPVLVFATHSTVAEAYGRSLYAEGNTSFAVVTGGHTTKQKEEILSSFRAGEIEVLVGTATLATGTDGLDKVCDTLVILDDTDDDALRRQLIGRIMPRGLAIDASMKRVYRLVRS